MRYYDEDPFFDLIDETEEEERTWTWQRVVYLVIALLIILAFIIYTIAPLLFQIGRQRRPDPPDTQPLERTWLPDYDDDGLSTYSGPNRLVS